MIKVKKSLYFYHVTTIKYSQHNFFEEVFSHSPCRVFLFVVANDGHAINREGTVFTLDDEIKPSEGHGHAYSNFRETGHPLAVKIGSISPYGGIVYSFRYYTIWFIWKNFWSKNDQFV